MNHKSSYSSFYGQYGPFESNPWQEEEVCTLPEQEELEPIDNSSLMLCLTIIEFSLCLKSFPIIGHFLGIVEYFFGSIVLNLLLFPLACITASLFIQNIPSPYRSSASTILFMYTFFVSLPSVFSFYHWCIDSARVIAILFWILMGSIGFMIFSIGIYKWIRLSWIVGSRIFPKCHKSKSMPNLSRKSSNMSIRSTRSQSLATSARPPFSNLRNFQVTSTGHYTAKGQMNNRI